MRKICGYSLRLKLCIHEKTCTNLQETAHRCVKNAESDMSDIKIVHLRKTHNFVEEVKNGQRLKWLIY